MTNSLPKTSEQVLCEARQWLVAQQASRFGTTIIGVTATLLLFSFLFGLTSFFGLNVARFGQLWTWTRIPWQPALAFVIWFVAAYVSAHSDSRRWQSYSLVLMVAGTAGMIVFALEQLVR